MSRHRFFTVELDRGWSARSRNSAGFSGRWIHWLNHAPKAERGRKKIASWPVSRVLYGSGFPERGSHSSGTAFACRLAQPTRTTDPETGLARLRVPRHPYSVLLPVGFTMPSLLPGPRWALTPPFHPYADMRPCNQGHRRGLLSVALSLRSPSPDVIRHRVSVEPGLSSLASESGRPADWRGGNARWRSRRQARKAI